MDINYIEIADKAVLYARFCENIPALKQQRKPKDIWAYRIEIHEIY